MEIYNIFCLISEICYLFPHMSGASDRERLDRWSARRHCLSRRHRSLNKISPTLSWTDADSLTVEQIYKDLRISENELDLCMLHPRAQFQEDVLRTPESLPRKAAVCPKTTRIKLTKNAVKPILGRINAPRLPNERYQKLQPPAMTERIHSECPS